MNRVKCYRTSFRVIPVVTMSRQSDFFCGGFSVYWLGLAIEYDHLSAKWKARKHG